MKKETFLNWLKAEYNLVENDYGDLTLPFTAFNDYIGGFVERANNAYFVEHFTKWIIVISIGYNGSEVAICPESLPKRIPTTHPLRTELIDILNTLRSYPLIDDELYNELQQDAHEEQLPDLLEKLMGDLEELGYSDVDDIWDTLRSDVEYDFEGFNIIIHDWDELVKDAVFLLTHKTFEELEVNEKFTKLVDSKTYVYEKITRETARRWHDSQVITFGIKEMVKFVK